MRAPLSTAALRVATPGRMALPSVEQRRILPLTALFVASSFGIALTAGFGLGTWLLFHATFGAPLPPGSWSGLVQVHGHAQLVGFAGLLVMGIGMRILPRFRRAAEPSTRAALLAYGLVVGGLAARAAQVGADGTARAVLLSASGAAELAGFLLYAYVAIRALTGGDNDHRADELFLGIGAVFAAVGAMWSAVALVPAIAGAQLVDPSAGRAHVAAFLLGALAATVIGVSLRVAAGFIAAPPPAARTVVAAAIAWVVGVTLTTLDVAAGPVVLLGAALVVVREVGPFRPSIAPAPLTPGARVVRFAFRGAYGWLIAGLALLALPAVASIPGATVAGRHAIALGFLTQIIFGVGSRLIPALTGGPALPVGAVRAAIVLANAAALLRATFEIVPAGDVSRALIAGSGPIALAGVVVFAVAAARSMRSAFSSDLLWSPARRRGPTAR